MSAKRQFVRTRYGCSDRQSGDCRSVHWESPSPPPLVTGSVTAVHIAAQVSSPAPNDVLISGTIKDLVVGSGIEFVQSW